MRIVPFRRTRLFFLVWVAAIGLSGCEKNSRAALTDYKNWLLACPNPFNAFHNPVVLRAGDVVIRVSDYQKCAQKFMPGAGALANITSAQRRQILNQCFSSRGTFQMIRESGVKMEPNQRLTLEQTAYTYLTSSYLKQMPVTEEEMRSYYKLHAADFASAEATVSHAPAGSPAQVSHFKALMMAGKPVPGLKRNKIMRINPPGVNIDYGFISTVFMMKPGQTMGPVRTPWGIEIIRRDSPAAQALPPTFDSVREQIRERLRAQKMIVAYTQWISKVKVEVDEPLLDKIDLSQAK